ncbi:MAG: hypothetical protein KAS15_02810, partial [Nanoarchaeota archaeon]|nr:hypothetical protein [Nanoarchaeota archaeon]
MLFWKIYKHPEKITLTTGQPSINLIKCFCFHTIMISEEELKKILFPHDKIRAIQVELAQAV